MRFAVRRASSILNHREPCTGAWKSKKSASGWVVDIESLDELLQFARNPGEQPGPGYSNDGLVIIDATTPKELPRLTIYDDCVEVTEAARRPSV